MRLLLTSLLALSAFSIPTFPAIAAGPAACLNGTAPAGHLRPGGYCEIAANLNSTTGGGGSGGGSGGGCFSHPLFGQSCYEYSFNGSDGRVNVYSATLNGRPILFGD